MLNSDLNLRGGPTKLLTLIDRVHTVRRQSRCCIVSHRIVARCAKSPFILKSKNTKIGLKLTAFLDRLQPKVSFKFIFIKRKQIEKLYNFKDCTPYNLQGVLGPKPPDKKPPDQKPRNRFALRMHPPLATWGG